MKPHEHRNFKIARKYANEMIRRLDYPCMGAWRKLFNFNIWMKNHQKNTEYSYELGPRLFVNVNDNVWNFDIINKPLMEDSDTPLQYYERIRIDVRLSFEENYILYMMSKL